MSAQFCIKKSSEDVRKEMEEITKKEMEKLTQAIKENPSLLKPKHLYESDSDDDDTSISSSSSLTSTSSSNSNYKNKIKKNSLNIFKKEQVIDKLEERNYYKSLDLSNLTLENGQLKDEIASLNKIVNNFTLQNKIIIDVIELSKIEPLKVNGNYLIDMSITSENMSSKMFTLEKEFERYKSQIHKLIDDLNSINDSIVKTHYNQELAKITILLNKNYDFNNKLVDSYLSKIKNSEKRNLILSFLFFSFIMIIIKDLLNINFIHQFN